MKIKRNESFLLYTLVTISLIPDKAKFLDSDSSCLEVPTLIPVLKSLSKLAISFFWLSIVEFFDSSSS